MIKLTSKVKWFVIFIILIVIFTLSLDKTQLKLNKIQENGISKIVNILPEDERPVEKNWRKLSPAQVDNLSELGRYLYLSEPQKIRSPIKNYTILIWKYGDLLVRRHIKHFTSREFDPFEDCSVKNCKITYKNTDLTKADAILFHLHRIKGVKELPNNYKRDPKQLWVFLTDESPFHTFLTPKVRLKDFDGLFNWSMTYRMDSEVPVPYGRTVLLPKEVPIEINLRKKADVLVAILGSNCGGDNKRWEYVKELQKNIQIDIFGKCGTLKCDGHFNADCKLLNDYKFYLAFENSNCDEYITEKLWWNAFSKNAIPIVMGGSKENYNQLLPPYSYIHVNNFATPLDLARYIIYLNKTDGEYLKYFSWKSKFEIKNEHGYFQTNSYHYCRLCEALNYNSRQENIYYDLEDFWSKNNCFPNWKEL